jgi:hypothetical protein
MNMRCAIGFLILGMAVGFAPTTARATVLVDSSISLTLLQILPSTGAVEVLSPFTASAFAQAADDTGGYSVAFNQVNDGPTPLTTAATAYASASGYASSFGDLANRLNASASSGVNIDGVTAAVLPQSTGGTGGLGGDAGGTGLFEIASASNTTVDVTFTATLSGLQTLATFNGGQSAGSEVIFQLLVAGIGPVVFLDSPYTIGPNQFIGAPVAFPSLTNTVQLQTNTEYTLVGEADAESWGSNSVPEPSSFFLTALSFIAVLFARRAWRNRFGPIPVRVMDK